LAATLCTLTSEVTRISRSAYVAGAANLPFSVMRRLRRLRSAQVQRQDPPYHLPFTQERLVATPAIRPDVTYSCAAGRPPRQRPAWGILGVQKEAALAAKRLVVTVEEIVDELRAAPNACVLPHWVISAVALVPGGAFSFVCARLLRS